jgi:hypothetical protein
MIFLPMPNVPPLFELRELRYRMPLLSRFRALVYSIVSLNSEAQACQEIERSTGATLVLTLNYIP